MRRKVYFMGVLTALAAVILVQLGIAVMHVTLAHKLRNSAILWIGMSLIFFSLADDPPNDEYEDLWTRSS